MLSAFTRICFLSGTEIGTKIDSVKMVVMQKEMSDADECHFFRFCFILLMRENGNSL